VKGIRSKSWERISYRIRREQDYESGPNTLFFSPQKYIAFVVGEAVNNFEQVAFSTTTFTYNGRCAPFGHLFKLNIAPIPDFIS